MKNKDWQVLPSVNGDAELPERLWAYDDFTPEEDQPPADFTAGLASLGFIKAALRRCAGLWCATAVVGLVCGAGVFVLSPPAFQASTSVVLTHNTADNPVDAVQTDLALAESHTVAQRTMNQLGLKENAASFVSAETITPTTDRVLLITVSAPSSDQAVLRARTLAAEFLQLRAEQLETQQQLMVAGFTQQIRQARQHISSITAQISQLSPSPTSHAQQTELTQLKTQRTDALGALDTLQQTAQADEVNGQATVAAETDGSHVLDPAAPIHHSTVKYALIYAAIGLVAGLVLGLAFVIIRALVSGRLRRRDDVADALSAPVVLSAGHIRSRRWRPARPAARGAHANDVQRIVRHLRQALPERRTGAAALAVVPVDNEKTVARLLRSLAVSCAQNGENVVVADLCRGAPTARLLGARKPGVRTVEVDGARLTVAVPRRDDVVPVGPVRDTRPQILPATSSDALTAAYSSADVLLTLVTLDPALGSEHLLTWASGAVVVMTAGRSSWTRIHAVGELVRLAGTTLVSAILLGTDKTDESLGTAQTARRRGPVARINGF